MPPGVRCESLGGVFGSWEGLLNVEENRKLCAEIDEVGSSCNGIVILRLVEDLLQKLFVGSAEIYVS